MKKQHFNFEEIFSFAWSKTKQHAWFIVCSFIIYSILMSAVRVAPVLDAIVVLMIGLSVLSLSLIIVRNESFSFADLFNKLRSPNLVLKFIALTVIYGLVVSLFAVPFFATFTVAAGSFALFGAAALTSKLLLVLGLSALLLIPGFYFTIRFKFYPYVLLENEHMTVPEIIKNTYRLTCCNFWSILWFFVMILVLNILGAFAFGVGLIITVPVSVFALAHFYRKLEGHTH
jgi:uncharacterized membrane protein